MAEDKNYLSKLYVKYLMSSYLYYNDSLRIPYSDTEFDNICKELLSRWDELDHQHKYLCDEEMLRCGTGYSIKFPLIVQSCAMQWSMEGFHGDIRRSLVSD